jgi:hypothetical protein
MASISLSRWRLVVRVGDALYNSAIARMRLGLLGVTTIPPS